MTFVLKCHLLPCPLPQGFVAYTVDTKLAQPFVVPFGAGDYRIRACRPHWSTELGLFSKPDGRMGDDQPERDVFFAWESAPDLQGVPASAVCTYARMRYFKVRDPCK